MIYRGVIWRQYLYFLFLCYNYKKGDTVGIFYFLKKKGLVPYEKICKELDIFTAISLAMPKMNNPFLLDNKSNHPIIFGYFIGVLDYMAEVYKLNEKDVLLVKTQYILHNFAKNDEAYTEELLRYCKELRQKNEVDSYALRGKLAMRKWKKGGPMAECAPMGLIRILNDYPKSRNRDSHIGQIE